MSPVELVARQCTIYVQEVYDETRETVIGTLASAVVDEHTMCSVKSASPADTPAKLGELLSRLGVLIGTRATLDAEQL